MPAYALHHRSINQSHLAQQPAYYRQFEHNTHHQVHHQQRIHVRLQCEHICYIGTNLISAKELDGKREYQQIVECCAQHKHQVAAKAEQCGVFPFVVIERWRYKAEELVDDIRRSHQNACIEGCFKVNHELFCKSDVHQMNTEWFYAQ